MSFCIKCEGIGAGRAYLCDRCKNEELKGTHEIRITELEKLIKKLLSKDTIYVIAENSFDYENWLIRNGDPSKYEYEFVSDIDKLRGLKGITVALALSEQMKKAIDFVNVEAAFGKVYWYDKGIQ
jgi:hypothetical protein